MTSKFPPYSSVEGRSSPTTRGMTATGGNIPLSHRTSLAENLKNHPPSPRSQRHPSFTQAQLQDLLNHPPLGAGNVKFSGRDWRQIRVGELVTKDHVRFVESDTGVEDATKLLIESGGPNVILVRERPGDLSACDSFDYSDLNAYLLVVLGLIIPNEEQIDQFQEIAKKASQMVKLSLKDIKGITKKEPLVILSEFQDLSKAIEIFASGIHRISIVEDGTESVIGILSQWILLKFLWDNASSFPIISQLYPTALRELNIGTHLTISINGDKPLTEALKLMHEESLTSVAVVDHSFNVLGNISTVDVKHLTNTSSLPLLKSSCLHFISVILSERGVENGQDSFPVFHVNPNSTLAYTTAKILATRSHRMWVVEAASPSHSGPATPLITPSVLAAPQGSSPASPSLTSPFTASTVSSCTGRLTGVISLTDILNLFARQSGLHTPNPNEQREHRRRSSSSSVRPSIDSTRGSSLDIRR